MVKVAICDDDKTILHYVKKIISEHKTHWQVYCYDNGAMIMEKMETESFAIYFLDIDLGAVNGYEIAKKIRLRNTNAIIIFLSSHEEYACEAFEVDALRFLRKPCDRKKLEEAINKAARIVEEQRETFEICYQGRQRLVEVAQICYIERQQRLMVLHLENGEILEFYGSIKEIEKSFSEKQFVRCHQGFIVNLTYVKALKESLVILVNDTKIPMSRGRKEAVRNAYMDYCWDREERE